MDISGNLGAMIHGIKTGAYLNIAGGKAKKSILMVDDITHLVPLVAEKGGVMYVMIITLLLANWKPLLQDNWESVSQLAYLIGWQNVLQCLEMCLVSYL